MSFTYDDSGTRTSKTVNGIKHTYYVVGSTIMGEEWGDKIILYLYDASGSPMGMMYRTTSYDITDWDVFWFEKNLQGDIVAVYNSSGTKVATYNYSEAWGNHSVTYTNGGGSTGAQYNPFRYRGYYYDTDLGMYYLQSRYYDSKICRFINADGYVSTGQGLTGYNMFAYCGNNPVNYVDYSGEISIGAASLILLFAGLLLTLTSSESGVIDGLQGLTDAVDLGLALGEFGESTQAHNKYIYAYSEAVIEYNKSKNIVWNDTLGEAFGKQKDPYNSYKESIETDAPNLYVFYYNDPRVNDVNFLADNFSTWAASAKGKIGSKAGEGVINKGYYLLEKILGLFIGIAK